MWEERTHTNYSRSFGLILDDLGAFDPTLPGKECGKVDRSLAAVCECRYTDAFSLKVLQRPRDVQEALAPGADDGDRGPSQLSEISCLGQQATWLAITLQIAT